MTCLSDVRFPLPMHFRKCLLWSILWSYMYLKNAILFRTLKCVLWLDCNSAILTTTTTFNKMKLHVWPLTCLHCHQLTCLAVKTPGQRQNRVGGLTADLSLKTTLLYSLGTARPKGQGPRSTVSRTWASFWEKVSTRPDIRGSCPMLSKHMTSVKRQLLHRNSTGTVLSFRGAFQQASQAQGNYFGKVKKWEWSARATSSVNGILDKYTHVNASYRLIDCWKTPQTRHVKFQKRNMNQDFFHSKRAPSMLRTEYENKEIKMCNRLYSHDITTFEGPKFKRGRGKQSILLWQIR